MGHAHGMWEDESNNPNQKDSQRERQRGKMMEIQVMKVHEDYLLTVSKSQPLAW